MKFHFVDAHKADRFYRGMENELPRLEKYKDLINPYVTLDCSISSRSSNEGSASVTVHYDNTDPLPKAIVSSINYAFIQATGNSRL